ncbi:MAG TPA: hypothetical protein VNM87_07575, partial [Candidatus Udaeobacter sp.]|nr:hypothetical protein [Candidatus Udaeobacter sp.]
MATPRWLRWSAIGLAGLLLVLAVGLALGVAWLRTEAGNARVSGLAATALGRALGLELELGKIELRGRRVTIGPIAVRDPAADSTAVPLMQVAAVRGEITWTRLLLRRVQVRSLVIDRPVITLPRSASGAIQWPKLGRERSAPSGSGSRLVRLAIEELALENGRLLVAAPPSGGRPVTIDSLNLRASAELDFAKPATRITLEDFTGVWREGNLALDSAAARLVAGALGGSLASDLQLSTTPWRFELAASPITLELGAQANRGRVVLDAPR